eukprot:scaffold975_cov394-Pavlova_lutheri.AAC.37
MSSTVRRWASMIARKASASRQGRRGKASRYGYGDHQGRIGSKRRIFVGARFHVSDHIGLRLF